MRSGWSDGAAQSPAATIRRIVHAGQRLVGEQPAHRVGTQPTGAGQVRHAEARGPDGDRARTHRAVFENDGIRADLGHHVRFEHGNPQPGQHLGHRTTARHGQCRPQPPATDQGDLAALLGELGGGLDPGQTGADDGHRRIRVHVVESSAQTLSLLQFCDGIGEFRRSGHRCRNDARAADRVDDVVVVQCRAGRQLHCAVRGVDTGGGVDDEPDALAEQAAVVGGGVVVACHQLVQPDPLDEFRPGVDERDLRGVPVAAHAQTVGRECSGVAAADDDDLGGCVVGVCVVFSHALKTPSTRRS